MLDVLHAKDILLSLKKIVLLIAQLGQTTTERHVLLVLPHKNGMVLNVLTDVPMEKSGMSPHKHASVQLANSGIVMLVSSVPTERLGTLTLKAVNAQFHQPGMESVVLFALPAEFITTCPTNANAQVDKHTMDMSVQ